VKIKGNMGDSKTGIPMAEETSPGTLDSRKRPLDSDSENAMCKKSHYIPGELSSILANLQGDGTYYLKILVPGVASGAIIGKGGETIAQLQKDTGGRIKMSKANDYYPGTTERVCLITGNVEALVTILTFIMEKVKEKPDPTLKAEFDGKNIDREKQLKVLVANSTAGMIIGKAGAYIKQIKEETGAYVQISQKAKDQSLAERCITINSNDMENTKNACLMVIAKIVEDPQSGSCLNVSYADVSGPVANTNPTGSPFANSPIGQHSPNTSFHASTNSLSTVATPNPLTAVSGLSTLLGGGVNLTLNLSSAFPAGGADTIACPG